MVRWRLKGCPRCGGDLLMERDFDHSCEQCLQCGFIRDLDNLQKPEIPIKQQFKSNTVHLVG